MLSKPLRLRSSKVILLLVLAGTVYSALTVSGGCGKVKPSLQVDASVDVTDSAFQQICAAAENVQIEAEGILNAGSYAIGGKLLHIPQETSFSLSANLPVDSPSRLSTRTLSGKFNTNREVTLDGIPLPQSVEIEKGKASAEVDLGRTLTAFILQIIQQRRSNIESHDLKGLLKEGRCHCAKLLHRQVSMTSVCLSLTKVS